MPDRNKREEVLTANIKNLFYQSYLYYTEDRLLRRRSLFQMENRFIQCRCSMFPNDYNKERIKWLYGYSLIRAWFSEPERIQFNRFGHGNLVFKSKDIYTQRTKYKCSDFYIRCPICNSSFFILCNTIEKPIHGTNGLYSINYVEVMLADKSIINIYPISPAYNRYGKFRKIGGD